MKIIRNPENYQCGKEVDPVILLGEEPDYDSQCIDCIRKALSEMEQEIAMQDQSHKWLYDDEPTEPGWYAQTHCWEVEEGLFPGAAKWNGKEWETTDPIVAFAGPFKTEAEAEQWAYDHDMEDY